MEKQLSATVIVIGDLPAFATMLAAKLPKAGVGGEDVSAAGAGARTPAMVMVRGRCGRQRPPDSPVALSLSLLATANHPRTGGGRRDFDRDRDRDRGCSAEHGWPSATGRISWLLI